MNLLSLFISDSVITDVYSCRTRTFSGAVVYTNSTAELLQVVPGVLIQVRVLETNRVHFKSGSTKLDFPKPGLIKPRFNRAACVELACSPNTGVELACSPNTGVELACSPNTGVELACSPNTGVELACSPNTGVELACSPNTGVELACSPNTVSVTIQQSSY
uniref:Uncharacterized protein n=1 Tax=Nothobranchius furzeri TaxID=105023 RepID=A0A8C6PBA5_NOTFU